MRSFKITIYGGTKPPIEPLDVNKDLQWFCTSLGLVGNRDRNLSTFRIFITLLKASRQGKLLSSDNIAYETSLSRATVIHHLTKLSTSGIILEEHERYKLAVDNLEELVKHVKLEIAQSMADLEEISKRIDEQLGLK